MAEDAGAADLLAGGRLQLGISRGSPEQVIDGWRYFGYEPAEGADRRRHGPPAHAGVPRPPAGEGFAEPNPQPMFPNPPGLLRLEPHSRGPARADLVGRRLARDRLLGGRARDEPDELDAGLRRRERRAVPRRSRRGRSRRFATHGRRRATRASRGSRSAAASSRSSTTSTGATSAAAASDATRSATSRRTRGRSSAAPMPPSPTGWSSSSRRTRRSPPPTPCC